MRDCLYISFFMLHFSAGCILLDKQQVKEVTGYTGGSVLLPCSCADPQSTVKTFKWIAQTNGNQWIDAFTNEKYSGRLVLFNESSPGNLSLLISGLRMEDEGHYMCMTEPNSYTNVWLTVKGCGLVRRSETLEATGYTGESVVLPCSCTEPRAKPEQIKWEFNTERNNYVEIFPAEHFERYKNRGKLLNQTTPGNLSLHILSLTKEDEGVYQCFVSSEQYIYVRLNVKEKTHVHTVHSSTYKPSQQTHELITIQQPEEKLSEDKHVSHHTPQYAFILMAVFASLLLLALLIFIYRRYTGTTNIKKVTNDSPELMREPETENEVTYSSVFHVKTASTPVVMQDEAVDQTEYASIKVK